MDHALQKPTGEWFTFIMTIFETWRAMRPVKLIQKSAIAEGNAHIPLSKIEDTLSKPSSKIPLSVTTIMPGLLSSDEVSPLIKSF
jgi:hypothetical protein